MRVLVVNAGSSSLKLRVLRGNEVLATDDVPAGEGGFDSAELRSFVAAHDVDAVGHRVVHGGTTFTAAVILDRGVRAALDDLTSLAPLHQPKSLAGIDAVAEVLPDVPAVACFDTAFHTTLPAEASTYAVPLSWREGWGVRRYGFHGLSHAYASRRAADLLGRDVEALRTVVCHLGAGASLCAVRGGQSVDTTMGFTPLEGLVMATRSGTVDPGLVLWLLEHAGMSVADVTEALEHHSGLLGLAGTADMREVLRRADHGDEKAALALDVYVHRLAAAVASMTVSLGGIDALVFTGGVGERAPAVRHAMAARLDFLGIAVDEQRNESVEGDADLSVPTAAVRTLVVESREDLQIAAEVTAVLS